MDFHIHCELNAFLSPNFIYFRFKFSWLWHPPSRDGWSGEKKNKNVTDWPALGGATGTVSWSPELITSSCPRFSRVYLCWKPRSPLGASAVGKAHSRPFIKFPCGAPGSALETDQRVSFFWSSVITGQWVGGWWRKLQPHTLPISTDDSPLRLQPIFKH